jgi:tetratricopeptide (TPR) repeat protein
VGAWQDIIMAEHNSSSLPNPSSEHRRIAAKQFERANQVITTGNHDYGIQLLMTCCKLDPANLIYRQALRQTEKAKFKNNMRGSRFAALANPLAKHRVKSSLRAGEYLKVLEYGEEVLARNPWDVSTQMHMAVAAEAIGLLDLAVWSLEQARQKNVHDLTVNRALARAYEKRGNFTQAIALWELIRKADPRDLEAQHKAKDLAASDTIARGRYNEIVSSHQAAAEGEGEEEEEEEEDGSAETELAEPAPPPFLDRVARETAPLLERLKAEPTNANLYLQLATVYRKADQHDKAREVLRQGLGPTANHFELGIELAELELEPFRRNLILTDEKLKSDPQNENLRKIRVRLLKEINGRELDLFREKSNRYPTEMGHRFELGVRLLRAGQIDEAIRQLQQTRADPRHQWRSLLYLGYCFKSRNNWRLAQRNFEDALQHLPGGEEATKKELLFQLAQGCAEAGELSRAIELGYELANLDFGYRDIGKLLDEWQTRLQKA